MIVSVVFVLSLKSPATAGETAVADTVTVVVSVDARLSRAVTVADPPFSLMDRSAISSSVTLGSAPGTGTSTETRGLRLASPPLITAPT